MAGSFDQFLKDAPEEEPEEKKTIPPSPEEINFQPTDEEPVSAQKPAGTFDQFMQDPEAVRPRPTGTFAEFEKPPVKSSGTFNSFIKDDLTPEDRKTASEVERASDYLEKDPADFINKFALEGPLGVAKDLADKATEQANKGISAFADIGSAVTGQIGKNIKAFNDVGGAIVKGAVDKAADLYIKTPLKIAGKLIELDKKLFGDVDPIEFRSTDFILTPYRMLATAGKIAAREEAGVAEDTLRRQRGDKSDTENLVEGIAGAFGPVPRMIASKGFWDGVTGKARSEIDPERLPEIGDITRKMGVPEPLSALFGLGVQSLLPSSFLVGKVAPALKLFTKAPNLATNAVERGIIADMLKTSLVASNDTKEAIFRQIAKDTLLPRESIEYFKGKLRGTRRFAFLNAEKGVTEKTRMADMFQRFTKAQDDVQKAQKGVLKGYKNPVQGFLGAFRDSMTVPRVLDSFDGGKNYSGMHARLGKGLNAAETNYKYGQQRKNIALADKWKQHGVEMIPEDMEDRLTYFSLLEQGEDEYASRIAKALGWRKETIAPLTAQERTILDDAIEALAEDKHGPTGFATEYSKSTGHEWIDVDKYGVPVRFEGEMITTPEEILARNTKRTPQKNAKNMFKGRAKETGEALIPRTDFVNLVMEQLGEQEWFRHVHPNLRKTRAFLAHPVVTKGITQDQHKYWGEVLSAVQNRGTNNVATAVEALAKKARLNLSSAVLGYRLSSIMIQPLAVFDAMAYAGTRWGARAAYDIMNEVGRSFINPKMASAYIKSSKAAMVRAGGEQATADAMRAIGATKVSKYIRRLMPDFEHSKILDKVDLGYQKFMGNGFKLLQEADVRTAAGVRKGIVKILKRNGEKATEAEADFLMNLVSGSSDVSMRPLVLSRGEMQKMWFTFQTFVLNRWGMTSHDMISNGLIRAGKVRDMEIAQATKMANDPKTAAEFLRMGKHATIGATGKEAFLKLGQELREMGFKPIKRDGNRYLVPAMTEQEAFNTGLKYGQEYVDIGSRRVYTDKSGFHDLNATLPDPVRPTPPPTPGSAAPAPAGPAPEGPVEAAYRGTHKAPGSDQGDAFGSLDNMDKTYPSDIYTSPDAGRIYGHGGKNAPMDQKSIDIIRAMKGKPSGTVTVYRAVPKGTKADINPGDWVTINEDYAKLHGERWEEGYDILKKEVKAGDIFTEGNSIHEFGYSPKGKGPVAAGGPELPKPMNVPAPKGKTPQSKPRKRYPNQYTIEHEEDIQGIMDDLNTVESPRFTLKRGPQAGEGGGADVVTGRMQTQGHSVDYLQEIGAKRREAFLTPAETKAAEAARKAGKEPKTRIPLLERAKRGLDLTPDEHNRVLKMIEGRRKSMASKASAGTSESIDPVAQSASFIGKNVDAVVAKSPKNPDKFQATFLDKDGVPNGDGQFDTFDEAVAEARRTTGVLSGEDIAAGKAFDASKAPASYADVIGSEGLHISLGRNANGPFQLKNAKGEVLKEFGDRPPNEKQSQAAMKEWIDANRPLGETPSPGQEAIEEASQFTDDAERAAIQEEGMSNFEKGYKEYIPEPKVEMHKVSTDYQGVVESFGGQFKGIQKGFTKKNGDVVPDQIQFSLPGESQRALPADEFTPWNVQSKLAGGEKSSVVRRNMPKQTLDYDNLSRPSNPAKASTMRSRAALGLGLIAAAEVTEQYTRQGMYYLTTGSQQKPQSLGQTLAMTIPGNVPYFGALLNALQRNTSALPPVWKTAENVVSGAKAALMGKDGKTRLKGALKGAQAGLTLGVGAPGTSQLFDMMKHFIPKDTGHPKFKFKQTKRQKMIANLKRR